MKPETLALIYEVLKHDVEDKKDRMLKAIECGYNNEDVLKNLIDKYREAFIALEDFCDWEDEQED